MITAKTARKLIDYNPETGDMFFRTKDEVDDPRRKFRGIFNTQFAGRRALNSVSTHGYFFGRIMGRRYAAHRVAFLIYYGKWPNGDIDHINGDPKDNRIENLRDVSKEQNLRNMRKKSTNTSGVTGVFWSKNANKWTAQIRNNGKAIHLGYFADFDCAVNARSEASRKFGYHENHGSCR